MLPSCCVGGFFVTWKSIRFYVNLPINFSMPWPTF